MVEADGRICVLDCEEERGRELETKYPGQPLIFHRCDIRSESQVVQGLRKAATETWPDSFIGGLIHCAGVAAASRTLSSNGDPGSLEMFKDVIDINLVGSFNVARLVAAEIVRQTQSTGPTTMRHDDGERMEEERGVIILTSSTSYQDGQVGQVAYAASKGGVASLVLPMARDLARFGIRVNAIAPSLFSTGMAQALSPLVRKNLLKTVEYPPRFGDPREFSSLVMECIRNTYLNGTVIRLDAAGRMGKL